MKPKYSGMMMLIAASLWGAGSGPALRPVSTNPVSANLSKEEIRAKLELLEPQAQAFSCRGMVEAVNGLRHLGKDEALKLLREYYVEKSVVAGVNGMREMNVICICRLLFVAPKDGWKIPWIDDGLPDTLEAEVAAKKQFPIYPLAVSNGVPFLLNLGWSRAIGGRGGPIPDEGLKHIDLCNTLELISNDLPISGFEDAAKKLLDSKEFIALKVPDHIRQDIAGQATRKVRVP